MSTIDSLRTPPIVEVVCGFMFDEIPSLDAMLVGKFWSSKSDAYPRRELKPPVRESSGFTVLEGVGPIRCWLISARDEWVVQVQPDRFYFNWRKRGDSYPRFGDHDGARGVLSQALEEFGAFTAFCEKETQEQCRLGRIELTKIDDVVFQTPAGSGGLRKRLTWQTGVHCTYRRRAVWLPDLAPEQLQGRHAARHGLLSSRNGLARSVAYGSGHFRSRRCCHALSRCRW